MAVDVMAPDVSVIASVVDWRGPADEMYANSAFLGMQVRSMLAELDNAVSFVERSWQSSVQDPTGLQFWQATGLQLIAEINQRIGDLTPYVVMKTSQATWKPIYDHTGQHIIGHITIGGLYQRNNNAALHQVTYNNRAAVAFVRALAIRKNW